MRNSVVAYFTDMPRHSSEPWHTSIAYAFAAFDILNLMSDNGDIDQHDVPFQWVAHEYGFRRPHSYVARTLDEYAALTDSELERSELAQAILDGRISATDVLYLFRVFGRYCNVLEDAGEGPAD